MGRDERTAQLAGVAAGLALGAGTDLPDDLALWRLAGHRPSGIALPSADPARALVAAMEEVLTEDDRRAGAHYTPAPLAASVVQRAFAGRSVASVVDPACGAGALLLAAADELAEHGVDRDLAVTRVFGADLDPLAVAVAEAALALWSGGTAPPPGRLVVADGLLTDRAAWAAAPPAGFDAVVGNPPFQGQLASETARGADRQTALRTRFGTAVAPYVDTAALFLLASVDLAAGGGRVALVQPQSTAASRDAAGVRAALAGRARLVEVWAPEGRPFAAKVHVCVPVLEVGSGDDQADWAAHLARGHGVPEVDLGDGPTVAGFASAIGGFRRHYYGLVGHVHEGGDGPRLITSGAIGVGRTTWGEQPIRFARQAWARPTVDVVAVRTQAVLDRWLDQVMRPKVVLASQTRVLEAAADADGTWVPCTPVVSVLPHGPVDVDRLAALLCSPPVSAWAAHRAAGTGLSPRAIRTSTALASAAPVPPDEDAWRAATAALAAGDLVAYADAAIAMYALPSEAASEVVRWWRSAS